MITAVVPVKTYSERLPNKNLSKFLDTNLYEHKLNQINGVFDNVVVSSESEDVLIKARKLGYLTHLRNPKYSTPTIPMSDVYRYIATEVAGDDIAWINVTNPLVNKDIYFEAVNDYCDMGNVHNCLLSVYNLQKYIWYKGEPLNWIPSNHPRSQDLEGLYAENFAINIAKRKDVIKYGTFELPNPYFFIMDELTSTKIDYKWQLDLCERIWEERRSSQVPPALSVNNLFNS